MTGEPSERRDPRALAGQWIFGLDRWLCRRFGIYEYSGRSECLFRAEIRRAEENMRLADGLRVKIGDPLLQLHLWNEHVPAMGREGPSVAWARRTARRMEASLRELARYLSESEAGHDVVALRAEMHLRTDHQSAQLARIFGRFGFEAQVHAGQEGLWRLVGENLLVVLLILASNPASLRAGVLRRECLRAVISRERFLRLYGRGAPAAARAAQGAVSHLGPHRLGVPAGRVVPSARTRRPGYAPRADRAAAPSARARGAGTPSDPSR